MGMYGLTENENHPVGDGGGRKNSYRPSVYGLTAHFNTPQRGNCSLGPPDNTRTGRSPGTHPGVPQSCRRSSDGGSHPLLQNGRCSARIGGIYGGRRRRFYADL